MRKLALFLACFMVAVSVSGCAFGQQGEESSPPAASSSRPASVSEEEVASESEETAPAESVSSAPTETVSSDAAAEESSQEIAESASESSAAESSASEGLVRYDSIYDIPFADLDYEMDRNALSLNGESWVAAPGPTQLGDLCFSDGKILVIQCFNRDTHNFIWFTVSFDPDYKAPYFPEETDNKLFTRAEGYTLYTDDGYSYTVTP